jgi:hypothetical protein
MGKASATQQNFRIRLGTASAGQCVSGWAAALNAQATISTDDAFGVRISVEETSGGSYAIAGHLFYSLNSGSWTEVTASSSVVQEACGVTADDALLTSECLGSHELFWTNGRFSCAGL